jgi:hypothetical protein
MGEKEGKRTRCGVQRVLFDFGPAGIGGLLFLPYDHFSIVRARCEYMAKLWMRPSDLPHRTRVSAVANEGFEYPKKAAKNRRKRDVLPFKCLTYAALGLAIYHVKDFNGTVRGACRKAFAIVIQLRVVLERDVFSTLTSGVEPLTRTYDHVLMSSFYRYWV